MRTNRNAFRRALATCRLRQLIPLGAALAVVVSCASGDVAQEEAPPAPSSAARDSGLEEIVVTGARASHRRVGRAGRHRESAPAPSLAAAPYGPAEQAGLPPLHSDEELWVIATPATDDDAAPADTGPGSGAMLASFADEIDPATGGAREVPLPLEHTAVNARIGGYVSTVDVRQRFTNPFDEKIEAVYLFPLPEKAAVTEFVMAIGERRIRGILREKEEAQAVYDAARAQGYRASLLVQHRPNVFEQKVANIEPGHAIDVDIRYFHTLAYVDGWYSFEFPTVVGPRYNPPGSADPLVAVPRGTAGGSSDGSAATSVPYLRPGERSGHDI
ncbi:MAG TPA: VIT domain-containing protein, partial [Woeseiaceae bacterium]|nr:VIT domain-containing protein [Woeseiaceae bacterium]